MQRPRLVILVGVLLTALALDASAHRITVFASVEDGTVNGMVYFSGGQGARQAPVSVLGPAGEVLLKLTTGGEGEFRFTPEIRCAHTIVCETADGHRAEYVLPAEELPATLPPCGGNNANQAESEEIRSTAPTELALSSAPGLEAAIEGIVSRHVGELRKEIAQYEEKVRFQSIMGGLGFIAGIMGVLFYFKARARRKDSPHA